MRITAQLDSIPLKPHSDLHQAINTLRANLDQKETTHIECMKF